MMTRILLVEDHEETINIMQQELEWLGYEVTVAKNGIAATKMASSQLPDLIVLDIILPKMDGLEVATRIRKDQRTRTIPILAATAKAMQGDREICLASGCDDYIAKPFTHRELSAAIKKLLNDESK